MSKVDDYQFYGQLCLAFGIPLLLIGIALPICTTRTYYTRENKIIRDWGDSPYLGVGIAMVIIGVILIMMSQILYREYRVRSSAQSPSQPQPP